MNKNQQSKINAISGMKSTILKKSTPATFHEQMAHFIQHLIPTFFTDKYDHRHTNTFVDFITKRLIRSIKGNLAKQVKFNEFMTFLDKFSLESKQMQGAAMNKFLDLFAAESNYEKSAGFGGNEYLNIRYKHRHYDDAIAKFDKKVYDLQEYGMYCGGISARLMHENGAAAADIGREESGLKEGETPAHTRHDFDGDAWNTMEYCMTKMLEFMYDMYQSGNHVFNVEKQLHNELLLTHTDKIDDSFLKLPYDTICVELPHNETLMCRSRVIRHIYITQWLEEDESSNTLEILCISATGTMLYQEFLFNGDNISEQVLEQVGKNGIAN